jgi:hypothetical protein
LTITIQGIDISFNYFRAGDMTHCEAVDCFTSDMIVQATTMLSSTLAKIKGVTGTATDY